MPTTPILYGFGNPLLDISANVKKEFLDKYEVKLNNAILCEDKHKPVYDDMVKNFQVEYIAGGATQNSVRVFQWMTQTPGASAFTGCVGDDAFGRQLRKSAEADGVAVHYAVDKKTPTGTCAVLVHETERSLIANLSAANNYPVEHALGEIRKIWESAKLYYSAGFFLTVSPPTIMEVGKHAAATGKTFCMNLSAPFITEFFADPLMAAMPYVDILFGNESEAQAFGKKQGYKDTSVAGVAKEVAKFQKANGSRGRLVVFTQGANPTIVVKDGKTQTFNVPPVKNIVDVNGAGDAFVGGFLAAYAKDLELAKCIEAAHYAASVVLQVSGTVLKGKPTFKF